MSQSVKPRKAATAPANPGCVDFISYCAALDGWLACGWIAREWQDTGEALTCGLDFGGEIAEAEATICLFPREDVEKIGAGFVLLLAGAAATEQNDLVELRLRSQSQIFHLKSAHNLERPPETEAISRSLGLLAAAAPSKRRAALLKRLRRPAYTGADTLQSLKYPVFLEADAAMLCPPSGLLVRGWFADPFRRVTALKLRCASRSAVLDPAQWIAIARPDVAEELAGRVLEVPENCGFIAFLPGIVVPGEAFYFEVHTEDDEIGFKHLPSLRSPGLQTIKDVLSVFDLRHEEMVRGYDRVIGPAVSALNDFRLARAPEVQELVFGDQPANPRCSIIVPLYARIDFLEYQLAFFSRSLPSDIELIYVLDDPALHRAAENLATSCLARFAWPFRLLILGANAGYAPANNAGLARARADHVCFLNSDVFPKRADWLDRMLSTLASGPRIGVVGALLLYEDDTIQHEGCSFERLPEFGGWSFCLHPNKGRAPGDDESPLTVDAVTGACLLISTALARSFGGFDEAYVIGDFEDADLCRKVQEKGLLCVVDRGAQLYHLERQSQGGQQVAWRLNLTLYNAWRFHQRWRSGLSRAEPAGLAAQ